MRTRQPGIERALRNSLSGPCEEVPCEHPEHTTVSLHSMGLGIGQFPDIWEGVCRLPICHSGRRPRLPVCPFAQAPEPGFYDVFFR